MSTERRDETRRQLRAAVAELIHEDGFQRWLQVRSRFHRYSFGNCLLIAAQRPDATRVAGYKAWNQFGRHVRRGEKAIRILAPILIKRTDDNGDETRAVVGFRSACVFDVTQTDGDPLPEPPEPIPHDGDDLAQHLPALIAHGQGLGYTVSFTSTGSAALGYCDPDNHQIVISDQLAPNAQVSTLVHELAHAHGLTYREHSRDECEVIVEATTAIVLTSLGYDPSRFSVPYIAGWAQDDAGLEALERFAELIDQTARSLERALAAA